MPAHSLEPSADGKRLPTFSRLHISLELFAFEMLVSYSRFSFVEMDTSPVAPPVVRDDPCTLEIKVGFVLLVG